jgi:hypothetical protein
MGRIRCEELLTHYLMVQGDSARIGPVPKVQDYGMIIERLPMEHGLILHIEK